MYQRARDVRVRFMIYVYGYYTHKSLLAKDVFGAENYYCVHAAVQINYIINTIRLKTIDLLCSFEIFYFAWEFYKKKMCTNFKNNM